jgi:RimJ/RimL family protein N-acetyltransferase
MPYFLTSERLGFRCWREDDLPLALSLWRDETVAAMSGGPFTDEQIAGRLEREMTMLRDHGIQYWPMFLRETDEFAGCAGLRPVELLADHPFLVERAFLLERERAEIAGAARVFEVGYHLCPGIRGRGLATEAALAVIEQGFGVHGADALFAGHHPSNDASRRVLLKVGFEYVRDEVYPPTGWIEPTYLLRRGSSPVPKG